MGKEPEQWFKQAQYDLSTAEAMFDAKKYIYVIFMCHSEQLLVQSKEVLTWLKKELRK